MGQKVDRHIPLCVHVKLRPIEYVQSEVHPESRLLGSLHHAEGLGPLVRTLQVGKQCDANITAH